MKQVIIYTDGSVRPPHGPGGWAAMLTYPEQQPLIIHGTELSTTNNRMELTAVIMAFCQLDTPCQVTLYTDSMYVIRGVTAVNDWKANGWRLSNGKPVANKDLWEELQHFMTTIPHKVIFEHVPAHSGNKQNEYVDAVARQQRVEVQDV